jgi:hypothetical protein
MKSRRFFVNTLNDGPEGPVATGRFNGIGLFSAGEALLTSISSCVGGHSGSESRVDGLEIYAGLAGVPYTLFRHWQITRNHESLDAASALLAECRKDAANQLRRSPTFLTGLPGVLALSAAVAHAARDEASRDAHIRQLAATVSFLAPRATRVSGGRSDDDDSDDEASGGGAGQHPSELLYGLAGLLYACAFVRAHCGSSAAEAIPQAAVAAIVSEVLYRGRRGAAALQRKAAPAPAPTPSPHPCGSAGSPLPSPSPPPAPAPPLWYTWHGKPYAGAAHGLAGICHVLLFFPLDAAGLADVCASLKHLVATRYASGNYPSSIQPPLQPPACSATPYASSSSGGDDKVHWCHGAPGAALALAHAWEVTRDPEFATALFAAADVRACP